MTRAALTRQGIRSAPHGVVDYERVSRSRDKVRAQKGAPPEWAADYKNLMLELEEGVRQYLAGQR